MTTEGVLIFGASGNIGIAVVFGALRSGRRAIAVVRSEASAGTLRAKVAEDTTVVEQIKHLKVVVGDLSTVQGYADVVSKAAASEGADGAKGFQHVWTSMGGDYHETPILELDRDFMREMMICNFEPNLLAYQSTMPHLLSLPSNIDATFTMCTGSQGNLGQRAQPAMVQGALFGMANVACRDNETTNVRFNEVYLAFDVQFEVTGPSPWDPVMLSSEFGKVYEQIMDGNGKDVKSCRVLVEDHGDVGKLRFVKRPNTGKQPYAA